MVLKAQKHSFLDLISEAEAVTRGVNLSEKLTHVLFRTIRMLSTPENASHGVLYSLNVNIPEISGVAKNELTAALKKLMSEQVIAQLFRFEYDPESGSLNPLPVFIAVPQDEKFRTESVFQEIIMQSVMAVESYLASLPEVSQKNLWNDFETDFVSPRIPAPTEIPSSIIDLFSGVNVSKFDILPTAEMIRVISKEIEEELLYRGKLIRINDYGLMPVRDKDYLLRLETAGDFLSTRLIPKHKGKGNLSTELQQISMEEAQYFLEEFVAETSQFLAKRAVALKRVMIDDPSRKSSGVRFQGSLAVETVIALDAKSRPRYEDKQISEFRQELNQWKKKFTDESPVWSDNFHVISESDFLDIAPFVRDQLAEDQRMIHGRWEMPGESMHVFFKKDSITIRSLVKNMQNLGSEANWKVLALKSLLDKNEAFFMDLFQDPEFLSDYGRMLRHAYRDYIPWYFRLLNAIGLTFFLNLSYQNAKRTINAQQQILSSKNKENYSNRSILQKEEKKAKLEKLHEMESAFKITEALDDFFLARKIIPSVDELKLELKGMDPITFRDTLARDGFKLVGAGKGSSPGESIPVYPMNYEWRKRAGRLQRMLEGRILELEEKPLNELEKIQLKRAKILKEFVGKKQNASAGHTGNHDDPYEKLASEIKKQKSKPVSSEVEEDLEV